MPRGKSTSSKTNGNGAKTNKGANLGFEEILWAAADKQLFYNTVKLEEQFALSAKLEAEIRDNLNRLGYGL